MTFSVVPATAVRLNVALVVSEIGGAAAVGGAVGVVAASGAACKGRTTDPASNDNPATKATAADSA